jgi:hypothetical protein
MAFSFDPEIEAILKQAMAAGGAQPPPTVRGDALALRQLLDAQMVMLDGAWEKSPEVTKVTHNHLRIAPPRATAPKSSFTGIAKLARRRVPLSSTSKAAAWSAAASPCTTGL